MGRGRGEEITLGHVAADAPQEPDLRGGLDTFADNSDVELTRHVDNIFNDDTASALGHPREVEKGPIQLNRVQRQILEQVKGGVARAKVVHGEFEPQPFNALHDAQEERGVLKDGALGELQLQ